MLKGLKACSRFLDRLTLPLRARMVSWERHVSYRYAREVIAIMDFHDRREITEEETVVWLDDIVERYPDDARRMRKVGEDGA